MADAVQDLGYPPHDDLRSIAGRGVLQLGCNGTTLFGMIKEVAESFLQLIISPVIKYLRMITSDLRIAAHPGQYAATARVHGFQGGNAQALVGGR